MSDHYYSTEFSQKCGAEITSGLKPVSEAAAASGLNLFHCWQAAELERACPGWNPSGLLDVDDDAVLMLFGNAGGDFWRQLTRKSRGSDKPLVDALVDGEYGLDPLDSFSVSKATRAIHAGFGRWLDHGAATVRFLYPQNQGEVAHHAPLQKLGLAAGWHQPSPLGTGIHPVWGLWYAYRALAIVSFGGEFGTPIESGEISGEIRTPTKSEQSGETRTPTKEEGTGTPTKFPGIGKPTDICATCASKACVTACPASALAYGTVPDMAACVGYRRHPASACAERCLAREACPVNQDDGYPQEQVSYHYRVALQSLLKYFP